MMEHQVYTPRLVSEALAALENRGALGGASGISDPSRHIAVYDLPKCGEDIASLETAVDRFTSLLCAPGRLLRNDSARSICCILQRTSHWRIIKSRGSLTMAGESAVHEDRSLPVSDNRPFVAQLGLWRNLTSENMQKVSTMPGILRLSLSKVTLLIILAVVVVIIFAGQPDPYLSKGSISRQDPGFTSLRSAWASWRWRCVDPEVLSLLIGASLHSIVTGAVDSADRVWDQEPVRVSSQIGPYFSQLLAGCCWMLLSFDICLGCLAECRSRSECWWRSY
ncbi:MAG: hypothetical protein IPH75_13365 [bacterium]|nr:hypothetical protein [bacterium]